MDQPERKSPLGDNESAASAADEAMKALTQLFSSRELSTKVHFRCGIDGPTEFDIFLRCARPTNSTTIRTGWSRRSSEADARTYVRITRDDTMRRLLRSPATLMSIDHVPPYQGDRVPSREGSAAERRPHETDPPGLSGRASSTSASTKGTGCLRERAPQPKGGRMKLTPRVFLGGPRAPRPHSQAEVAKLLGAEPRTGRRWARPCHPPALARAGLSHGRASRQHANR